MVERCRNWFVRAALSSSLCVGVVAVINWFVDMPKRNAPPGPGTRFFYEELFLAPIGWFVLCAPISIVVTFFLSRRLRSKECRCRECDAILFGLSEARCPHCQEPI